MWILPGRGVGGQKFELWEGIGELPPRIMEWQSMFRNFLPLILISRHRMDRYLLS